MKRLYVQVAICTTILAVLAVPAAVAAQDRLTGFEFHSALSRPMSSVGPVGPSKLQATMAPEGPITVYIDRATFDAANPGLPIEDWQDFTDVILGCDAPANNGTSCPGGYNVGDILPGLEIDCAANSGPGGQGLVIIPTGFDGNPSIEFASNFFADNTIINLSPAVAAIGFDVACHFGSPHVDILIFDGLGAMVWAGNYSPCNNTASFVGWSSSAPEGIGRVELNDPTGVSVESVDNVAFGTVAGDPGQAAYVRSTVGPPWNQTTNEAAMDDVFGPGGWEDLRYETLSVPALLSAQRRFIFMEGSDDNADELESFLIANLSAIEAWVNDGGRLLLNAAPNEGNGMSYGFGGVNLTYVDFGNVATAVDPSHPIFNGPFTPITTNYTGTSFGHASVTGGGVVSLINNESLNSMLAEKGWGVGRVSFGGMTTDNFHSPQPEAGNLRRNIIHDLRFAGLPFGDGFESGDTSAWSSTVP